MRSGSPIMTRAMATRCCWPPDSSSGQASALSARPSRPSRWRARVSSHAGSDNGVVETPAMTFCSAVSDDSRLRFWNRKRTRLRRTSSSVPPARPGPARAAGAALRRPAHGAEDGQQGRLARARRAGDDHQLALADLHVDVEQHVDALRAVAIVVMDVDRLDDRRSQWGGCGFRWSCSFEQHDRVDLPQPADGEQARTRPS